MNPRHLATCSWFAAALMLPSCATTNGVRWTYGKPSIWPPPAPESEKVAIRAVVGLPVIVTSVAVDAVTWPFQLLFGVWPMWGDDSTQLVPPDVKPRPIPTAVAPTLPPETGISDARSDADPESISSDG